MEHTFLGWEKPCLQTVTELLIARHKNGRYVDLSNMVLVFPSRVASRRLLTLLAQKAYEHGLTIEPPRVKAVGDFPELLYSQKYSFASALVQQIVWTRALQKCAKEMKLSPVIPQAPDPGDVLAWMELGREMSAMQQELAAEGMDFASVLEKWGELERKNGGNLPESERRRWETLERVQRTYHAMLDDLRLWDKQSARLYALKNSHPQRDFNIRFQIGMIGCVDLNRIQKLMLLRVPGNVEIFTFAPESLADRFDALGCLEPEKWRQPPVEIPDEMILQVTKPEDQARAVTDWLRGLDGQYAADEITVGVLDDELEPYISQRLRMAGVTAHYAGGTELSALGPWRLLEVLTDWLDDRRYTHFAALVRHPDVERYLRDVCQVPVHWVEELDAFYHQHLPELIYPKKRPEGEEDAGLLAGGGGMTAAVEDAEDAEMESGLKAAGVERNVAPDTFFAEENQEKRGPSGTPGMTAEPSSEAVMEALTAAAGEEPEYLPAFQRALAELSAIRDTILKSANYHNAVSIARSNGIRNTKYATFASMVSAESLEMDTLTAPLSVWGCCVVDFLLKIYGWRVFNANLEQDHQIARSCLEIRRILVEEMQLPQRLMPKLKFADCLRLFLSQTAENRLNPLNMPDTLDLRGWLELPLDDVPATILTGFNDGVVPQAKNSHAFFPNKLREVLGMETNNTRLARDTYILSVLLATREELKIVFGRLSAEGNVLMPSRLLLTGDDATLVRRAKRFFTEVDERQEMAAEAGAVPTDVSARRPAAVYEIPEPVMPAAVKTRMSVSEFNDYLACAYRYYLRHIQKLHAVDDLAEELDGGQFGNLAHEILRQFGQAEVAARAEGRAVTADTLEEETARVIRVLEELLEAEFSRVYGKNAISTLFIQKEQLRQRLRRFARHQAQRTLDGWEIRHVEIAEKVFFRADGGAGAVVEFSGGPMLISGKIDRVDYHPGTDTWAILDYKTADAGLSPEEVHHKYSVERLRKRGIAVTPELWQNLQLPLYRQLAASLLELGRIRLELGYVLLPKDLGKAGFRVAAWEEEHLRTADEMAQRIIRKVRAGEFPQSTEKPAYEDEFTWIMKE